MEQERGRHRRPGPVKDIGMTAVLFTGAVLCLGTLLWAAVILLAHLIGWAW